MSSGFWINFEDFFEIFSLLDFPDFTAVFLSSFWNKKSFRRKKKKTENGPAENLRFVSFLVFCKELFALSLHCAKTDALENVLLPEEIEEDDGDHR